METSELEKYEKSVVSLHYLYLTPFYSLRPETMRLGDTDLGSTEDDEFATFGRINSVWLAVVWILARVIPVVRSV